jgi:uncharacterized membrane protein YfhO
MLVLAIGTVLWIRREKLVMFFSGLALFCLIVIYKVSFLGSFILTLPGFKSGANHRMLFVFAFCVAVLGSYMIDRMMELKVNKKKLLIIGVVSMALLAVLYVATLFKGTVILTADKLDLVRKIQGILFVIAALQIAVALTLVANINKRYVKVVLFILIFAETGLHGSLYNAATANKDFYPEVASINFYQQQYAKDHAPIYFTGDALVPNLSSWYGFAQLNTYDAMDLHTHKQLKDSVAKTYTNFEMTKDFPDLSALGALGVKTVVFSKLNNPELFAQAKTEPALKEIYSDPTVVVMEIEGALPRAYLSPSSDQYVANNKITNYTLNMDGSSELTYNSDQETTLVLNENYYPGWVAQIEGNSIVASELNGLKTFRVPAGEHDVRISYQPRSFRTGLIISLASLALWMLLYTYLIRKEKKL